MSIAYHKRPKLWSDIEVYNMVNSVSHDRYGIAQVVARRLMRISLVVAIVAGYKS